MLIDGLFFFYLQENHSSRWVQLLPVPVYRCAHGSEGRDQGKDNIIYRIHCKNLCVSSSVADPGCLSRIPDPDFYPSRISDPGSRILDPGSKNSNKRERWKKLDVKPFYVATKFNKILNYFSFEVLKKKIWANFQRIVEKLSKSSSKYGLGIRDPGVKKAPDPGSGSATLDSPDWSAIGLKAILVYCASRLVPR